MIGRFTFIWDEGMKSECQCQCGPQIDLFTSSQFSNVVFSITVEQQNYPITNLIIVGSVCIDKRHLQSKSKFIL